MIIKSIDFYIPYATKKQIDNGDNLIKILAKTKHFKTKANNDLESQFAAKLSPKTIFKRSEEFKTPSVSFTTSDSFNKHWSADNLTFGFNLLSQPVGVKKVKARDCPSPLTKPINSQELVNKIAGRVKEVNHAGINFSPNHLQEREYSLFKQSIAARSNLYNYPTGEEWPFIIPASLQEFNGRIENESLNRNPKFEIVYSKYNPQPVIQIDLATTFTKKEIFKLFPDPYGISFDGLEDVFRSVFVDVDWGGVLLRFDLGFRKSRQDFGYWIIKEGGRI